MKLRQILTSGFTGTAAALEALHIPAGTQRVIFKTLNTKR